MVKKKEAGNIHLNSGELLKFSARGLAEVLANQTRCLFCGEFFKSGGDLAKTDEHVVPKWVIDCCNLGSTKSGQPNRQPSQYAQLTVRCCKGCNQGYSDLFEKPVSTVFKEGFDSVFALQSTISGANLLFAWVAFIAAKKRLQSASYRYDPDTRADTKTFEDEKGIESISWLLVLPRGLRFRHRFGNETLFARFMMVFRTVEPFKDQPTFDLVVDHNVNTAMITVGDTSVLCGFSHSCPPELSAARFKGIPKYNQYSQLQVKEIFSELTVEAWSFEQKHYCLSEYNGRLSLGTDKTNALRTLDPRRDFMTMILLHFAGELIVNYVTAEDYWNYVTSNLKNGRGSFFPDRGKEPYFDPASFRDPSQEFTKEIYNERMLKLGLLGINKDPLLSEEIHEIYKAR